MQKTRNNYFFGITVTWTAGWYAVSGTVTIDQPITVTGAVNLILTDGCDLTAAKGIVVTDGNSLTIYAQSKNGGTLNATGTTDDSGNASAGIGGSTDTSSLDSGSITIHGGVINATGGASNWYGGAGIGGGTPSSGNGGNSGVIKIYGGTITAESRGSSGGAGIGGGGGGATGGGGDGTNIIIYGGSITATSHSYNSGGAGIGGGGGSINGGTGDITIDGGTVHATGGYFGAGIGGGGSGKKSGDGNVTISGGTVTAMGYDYAAGIGGGGGIQYTSSFGDINITGGTGSVTISGGIVDASSPTDVSYKGYEGAPIGNGGNTNGTATVNKTTGIIFENGVGTVCGDVTLAGSYTVPAGYSLHIPAGASLSGSGTLSGGETFTTDLSEDMISVPEDLYYDGTDRTAELQNDLSAELNKGIEICGQTFTVSGWTLAVAKAADSDLTYTATYTNKEGLQPVQKTIIDRCVRLDETALSFAEIKALCAGDPRIKERMDLDVEVSRLKLMKADHQSKQYRLEDQLLKHFPEEIEKHKGFISRTCPARSSRCFMPRRKAASILPPTLPTDTARARRTDTSWSLTGNPPLLCGRYSRCVSPAWPMGKSPLLSRVGAVQGSGQAGGINGYIIAVQNSGQRHAGDLHRIGSVISPALRRCSGGGQRGGSDL